MRAEKGAEANPQRINAHTRLQQTGAFRSPGFGGKQGRFCIAGGLNRDAEFRFGGGAVLDDIPAVREVELFIGGTAEGLRLAL